MKKLPEPKPPEVTYDIYVRVYCAESMSPDDVKYCLENDLLPRAMSVIIDIPEDSDNCLYKGTLGRTVFTNSVVVYSAEKENLTPQHPHIFLGEGP